MFFSALPNPSLVSQVVVSPNACLEEISQFTVQQIVTVLNFRFCTRLRPQRHNLQRKYLRESASHSDQINDLKQPLTYLWTAYEHPDLLEPYSERAS
jgi:hypothetical protein